MTYQEQYDSPLGMLTMTSNGESLTELRFSEKSLTTLTPIVPVLDATRRWLDSYFKGEKPDFTPQVTPFGTLFQRRVWTELLSIPYGQTVTYGDIARRIDCKSAQAVGCAVGRNPIAIIIPCHRVVGSNGSLTGYAYDLECKRQLIMLEQKTHNYGQ